MKQLIFTLCFSLSLVVSAQVKESDVLFTVDDESVLASDFIRVYNKNLDLVKDESQKDVDAYLDLFINYQLKVKEAKRLELDKDPKYVREFTNYKNQLTKNYLTDNKVTDKLVKEAYDRSIIDIKASHILVRLDENATDTLAVYNRVLDLRKRVLKEGYADVQKDVHDGKTVFAEDLGYFTAFKMVYPFETAAYNTEVGDVSMPFRTRFGYHVVLVHEKAKSQGEVTVAHIMVSNKQKDSLMKPKERIMSIHKKYLQGEKFESLAKQFSDDKSTSAKGGVFSPFTRGQLGSEAFESMAFRLKEPGEVSEPFETQFGWHIIKLIRKKGIQSFEDAQPTLQNKVKRDSRSKIIQSAQVQKLKKRYNVADNPKALSYFQGVITNDYFKSSWVVPQDLDSAKAFVTINDKVLTYHDFAQYLFKGQRMYMNKKVSSEIVINQSYKNFLESELLLYQRENLENENQEFAHVLKEYRDGLLLFDLMEKQVWNAASKDTLGLEAYYNANKSKYMWNDRVGGTMFSSADEKVIKNVIKALNEGTTVEAIESKFNSDDAQNVIKTSALFQAGDQNLPTDFEFKKGISKVYHHNDAYHVFVVKEVKLESQKTLEEARGKVISDYQNQIEADWIKALNERYNVVINKKVLKKVKSQIAN